MMRPRGLLIAALLMIACGRKDPQVCPDPVKPKSAETARGEPTMALDLPKAATGDEVQYVLRVRIDAAGAVTINGLPASDDAAVIEAMSKARKAHPDLRAVVTAHELVSYAKVIRLLDSLKRAGVDKIGMGIELEPPPAPKK